jgi:hypothetical protein
MVDVLIENIVDGCFGIRPNLVVNSTIPMRL